MHGSTTTLSEMYGAWVYHDFKRHVVRGFSTTLNDM